MTKNFSKIRLNREKAREEFKPRSKIPEEWLIKDVKFYGEILILQGKTHLIWDWKNRYQGLLKGVTVWKLSIIHLEKFQKFYKMGASWKK